MKTAISIQKSRCYVTLPYYGELNEKMMPIFQDYDISTQLTPVSTLTNSLVHPKDNQRKRRQSDIVYEFCCKQNFVCQDAYIDEASQPLQHRLKQRCRYSYNG